MRILVLSDRYPPLYEGAYELNCQQVTDGLRARGHELTVLTTTFGLDGPRVEGDVHRVLRSLDHAPRSNLDRRRTQAQLFVWARQNYRLAQTLCAEIKPDLVFVWHMLGTSIPPILGVQAAGARTVYRVGSHWLVNLRESLYDEPHPLKRRFRATLNGPFADLRFGAAIFNSETLRDSYQQAGFDVSRTVMISSGIPEAWIAAPESRQYAPDSALRLLYVGRLEENKGTRVAIEAVAQVIRDCPNVCLDLYGRGEPDYIDQINHLIASSGAADRVRLQGFVPRDEMLRLYGRYDVLLFTTPAREGLPMAVLEAMSQGLAVIASDIGGPKDLIAHNQTGLLVPPGDPAALAQAVSTIAHNPAMVRELGTAAINEVRENHTFSQMLDAYERYLESQLCSPEEN